MVKIDVVASFVISRTKKERKKPKGRKTPGLCRQKMIHEEDEG